VHYIFKEFICIVMLLIFSWRTLFPHQEYARTIALSHSYHLSSEYALDSLHHFILVPHFVRRAQNLGVQEPSLGGRRDPKSPFLFGAFFSLIQFFPLVT
jgi:hypothetical protein